ncbi:MAG: cytochrome c oxidase assembly protein [Rhizobiales bacterium]|nr:cytochrome c oxidase assembly protein [Hyphomicrobiales bacterium]
MAAGMVVAVFVVLDLRPSKWLPAGNKRLQTDRFGSQHWAGTIPSVRRWFNVFEGGILFTVGPLALQMGQHIFLMNVVALAAASSLGRHMPFLLRKWPVAAAVVQVVLLWSWHAPPVLSEAIGSSTLHMMMQATLFLSALWFWRAVLAISEDQKWLSIGLLLFTSKLFCLLGVLLIFAGRDPYQLGGGHVSGEARAISGLEDQQLAGLLMIVVCPLSYLGVGVFTAARWVGVLERRAPHG